MARITVEDCLQKENNRFALVLLASRRTKQLLNGAKVLISDARGNKALVTSLREIAAGEVRFMTPEEKVEHERKMAEIAEQEAQNAAVAPAAPQSLADVGASLFRTESAPPQADANGSSHQDEDDDDDDDIEDEDEGDDEDDDDDEDSEEKSPKTEEPKGE